VGRDERDRRGRNRSNGRGGTSPGPERGRPAIEREDEGANLGPLILGLLLVVAVVVILLLVL
jgi:hypothetical protein